MDTQTALCADQDFLDFLMIGFKPKAGQMNYLRLRFWLVVSLLWPSFRVPHWTDFVMLDRQQNWSVIEFFADNEENGRCQVCDVTHDGFFKGRGGICSACQVRFLYYINIVIVYMLTSPGPSQKWHSHYQITKKLFDKVAPAMTWEICQYRWKSQIRKNLGKIRIFTTNCDRKHTINTVPVSGLSHNYLLADCA